VAFVGIVLPACVGLYLLFRYVVDDPRFGYVETSGVLAIAALAGPSIGWFWRRLFPSEI
jgi:hypothetical protein